MYIIWTGNKNPIDVMEKASELFSGDNVVSGRGHYKGKAEESLRIEIFNDLKPWFNLRVFDFARWIADYNDQESVAVLRQDDPQLIGRAPSIVRNEFGIEQLDEPEGVYDKTPAVELPPGDVSGFENPFGAITCVCGLSAVNGEIPPHTHWSRVSEVAKQRGFKPITSTQEDERFDKETR